MLCEMTTPMEMYARQSKFDVRVEYGPQGLACLSADDNLSAIVIVDVLSFTTCVDVAVARGARTYPYPWALGGANEFAKKRDAVLAGSRNDPSAVYSLSPESLTGIPNGTRLVLPSPNGSTLSFAAADLGVVIAGSVRNRRAVARFLERINGPIGLIAAGERWPDGTLRPCLEDLIGVGGIVSELTGRLSPEAENAMASFEHFDGRIPETLASCSSGQELILQGFEEDVEIASKLDASESVPVLVNDFYERAL